MSHIFVITEYVGENEVASCETRHSSKYVTAHLEMRHVTHIHDDLCMTKHHKVSDVTVHLKRIRHVIREHDDLHITEHLRQNAAASRKSRHSCK